MQDQRDWSTGGTQWTGWHSLIAMECHDGCSCVTWSTGLLLRKVWEQFRCRMRRQGCKQMNLTQKWEGEHSNQHISTLSCSLWGWYLSRSRLMWVYVSFCRSLSVQRVDRTRSWVEKGQTTWQSLCSSMVVEVCHGIYNYFSADSYRSMMFW